MSLLYHLEPQNITLKVEEGHQLNITCRSRMESSSSVLWLRDNKPIRTGDNRFLVIKSINRSQAGNYICVSLSPNGNHSSPFTTVDVLCESIFMLLSLSVLCLKEGLDLFIFYVFVRPRDNTLENHSAFKFSNICVCMNN